MIGKLYFLLALLQAVVSEEWRADIPTNVTAQRGLCARIPCHYSYPPHLKNESRTGVWFNSEEWAADSIVFHSRNHVFESSKFRHRTQLTGDLNDGDCSLVINNVKQNDQGPYFFRVEFKSNRNYDYPVVQLYVSDFMEKPSIVTMEMVVGKPVNVICTFNTTCDRTAPNLTWVTPTDVPSSVSSSITQQGDTLTYTSVLTLTPELKDHGQNLTCRVRYPFVSSEWTLILSVHSSERLQKTLVISLTIAAVVIILLGVVCFTLKIRRRTDR
ncbi:myeloid cell surface antigen CD33-like [Pristis pectinata]|uniref:myeloid cell surface antigen CD33-like n=1 Tax=Pristis pectinata TaxID=685728 RepID=UPI00223DD0E6|nr:myeloid cell surface antigen CD33-like [Pristis pectinata]